MNQTTQASLFATIPTQPSTADRLIKLRDVERILSSCFHVESRPSRNTIIGWIEEGTLLGMQLGSGRNYYVFESSLDEFKEKLQSQRFAFAA